MMFQVKSIKVECKIFYIFKTQVNNNIYVKNLSVLVLNNLVVAHKTRAIEKDIS